MSVVGSAITYAAIGGGAASLIGGLLGSDASRHAADTQADASRAATQAQLQMFGTVNQQQLPYRQSGYNALNALNYGLGLPTGSYDGNGIPAGAVPGGAVASPSASMGAMPNLGGTLNIVRNGAVQSGANPVASVGAGAPTREQFTTTSPQTFIPSNSEQGANTGGSHYGPNGEWLGSGSVGSHPATTFDQTGFDKATAAYNATQAPAQAPAPYAPPGGMTGGQFTHQFNAADLNANLAPNYQFQLDQGLGAVRNASNLSTGLVSGNTLKGINDYAQNYAGGAYQQAYNNYNQNQTNIFNRLSNIAGLGQTANQSTGSAASSISPGISSSIQNVGAATASGYVGQANALSGAVNNAAGWYGLNQIMNSGGGNSGGGNV